MRLLMFKWGLAFLALVGTVIPVHGATLTLVTEAWPPYVFQEDGRPAGFDYETSLAVLESLGYEVKLEFYPWKRCVDMVRHGLADALLDTGKTAARERSLAFPDEPLSRSRTALFFLKQHPIRFESPSDLNGLVIGTQHGYAYSKEFQEADGFVKEPVSDITLNFRKLQEGRIDAFMANMCYGLYMAKRLEVIQLVGHTDNAVSSGEVYLAFSRVRGLEELAMEFGRALKRFKGTAEYEAILKRYGQ